MAYHVGITTTPSSPLFRTVVPGRTICGERYLPVPDHAANSAAPHAITVAGNAMGVAACAFTRIAIPDPVVQSGRGVCSDCYPRVST